MSSSKYTGDTTSTIDNIISTPEEHDILETAPLVEIPQHIDDDSHIEFFECYKCGEFNMISSKVKKRRVTRTRHVKVNDVTWGSLKKYATINNVTIDYALMTLLMSAQTKNISYLINERKLIEDKHIKKNKKSLTF